MYAMFIGQKWVTPGEFWSLPPGELWWIVDAMMPKSMDADTAEELYAALMAAKAAESS